MIGSVAPRPAAATRRQFRRDRAGVAATEFALIAPVVVMLLLAGFDFGHYVLATQRVQAVANSIAEMLAETPVSASATNPGDGVVTANDLQFYYNSAMFTFPDVLPAANAQGVAWSSLLSVQMTSIEFTPTPTGCTTTCTYVPNVVWALGARACGTTFSAVSDTSAYSATTLPSDIYGPGSMIVVDVSYTWAPTVGASFLPSIPIERSVYLAPRNVPIVESQAYGTANPCPGVL
jgi:Flp pilus assembly protein TadG